MISLASVGIVLVVLAVVAVVLLTRGGAGDWDSVVAVDPESGELVVYDADGEEVERIDTGVDEIGPVVARGGYVIVNDGDQAAASIIDIADGEVVWEGDVVDESGGGLWWLAGSDVPIAVSAATSGGNIVLVDVEGGEEIDVGAAAGLDEPQIMPTGVRSSPDGRHVAMTDLGAPEGVAVLVDVDDGTATAVPGHAADLTDDTLAVLERSEDDAEVRFHDAADGEEIGSASLPGPPLGVMLTGREDAVGAVIAEDGGATTFEVAAGDDEATTLAEIDVDDPSRLGQYPTAERMLLSADGQTVLLDAGGEEVARVDGQHWPVLTTSEPEAACALTIDDDETARLLDLESGDEVATADDISTSPPVSSLDGCTVAMAGTLLTESETSGGDDEYWTAVAPDGTAAVVRRDEESEISDLDDRDGDPVRLDTVVVGFVTR